MDGEEFELIRRSSKTVHSLQTALPLSTLEGEGDTLQSNSNEIDSTLLYSSPSLKEPYSPVSSHNSPFSYDSETPPLSHTLSREHSIHNDPKEAQTLQLPNELEADEEDHEEGRNQNQSQLVHSSTPSPHLKLP